MIKWSRSSDECKGKTSEAGKVGEISLFVIFAWAMAMKTRLRFQIFFHTHPDGITPDDMAKWQLSISKDTETADDSKKGESRGIYELMGIAIGRIGMTLDEFCKYDFDEFGAICQS